MADRARPPAPDEASRWEKGEHNRPFEVRLVLVCDVGHVAGPGLAELLQLDFLGHGRHRAPVSECPALDEGLGAVAARTARGLAFGARGRGFCDAYKRSCQQK